MKKQKNEFLEHNGGMWEVLKIAFPLILAASAHAVNLLSDRIMLDFYSDEAVAGSMAAGLTSFTLSCFFLGIIGYTGTFVAQYYGAGATDRVGTAVWQGIFLSLIGGVILATGWFWGGWLFSLFGHDPKVVGQETAYFKLLSLGAVLLLLNSALFSFWGGRGKTGLIMVVNLIVTALNVPFNYALIYGKWGFPEMGIAGAAWGTNLSALCGTLILLFFFFAPSGNRRHFGILTKILDWEMFKRLIRFGLPNGVQFALDLASFNIFIIMLGRYGVVVQAAASIAFGLNSLAFTPMIGIGQTVSILVGQSIGAQNIPHAKRSVGSARNVVLLYMGFMALLFVIYPDAVLWMFSNKNPEVVQTTKLMMKFIAGFMLFDGLFIVYCNAIKAAGDTLFAMIVGTAMALLMQALPALVLGYLKMDFRLLWICQVIYVVIAGSVFYLRYRSDKWTRMKVIEDVAAQDA